MNYKIPNIGTVIVMATGIFTSQIYTLEQRVHKSIT